MPANLVFQGHEMGKPRPRIGDQPLTGRGFHHLFDASLLGDVASDVLRAHPPGHFRAKLKVGTQGALPHRLYKGVLVTLQRMVQGSLAGLLSDQLWIQRSKGTRTRCKASPLDSQLGCQGPSPHFADTLLQVLRPHLSQRAKQHFLGAS